MKSFYCMLVLVAVMSAKLFAVQDIIKTDTVGFRPGDIKYFTAIKNLTGFSIIDALSGKPVYSGSLKGPVHDNDSGDDCFLGDFSGLTLTGKYYIETGAGRSCDFRIAGDIYNEALYKTMHGFYLQRCGIDIKDKDGFSHAACHLKGADCHESTNLDCEDVDVSGGWHDAGDYGKYSVNSGISTGTMLLMFERYKDRLIPFLTGIPDEQKSAKLPDTLNEAKWNLDWMLKMQDEKTGGVFHKATPLRFPDMDVMPEADKSQYAIYEITTAATADFAAVMAIASRVFITYDSDYSARCIRAAESAWVFLELHPAIMPEGGFKNPPDTSTGNYSDADDSDERLWAAAELFSTTGSGKYNEYFLGNYKKWSPLISGSPSWRQVQEIGMVSYCMSLQPAKSQEACGKIKESLDTECMGLVSKINENGYRNLMRTEDYIWGSNAVALNYAVTLLCGAGLLNKPEYENSALEVLHYILGRNPFGMSYVTAVGAVYPMNIHHRPSVADKKIEPWPGLMAGGPNKKPQDKALKALPANTPPARCYADSRESYASNEIAINWNAPLVYVLAAFIPDINKVATAAEK
jgi:endoglucanase